MLTLQELKKITDVPRQGEKLPTAKQLRESGAVTARERMGQDSEISAFQNGYALYRVRNHSTVFPIHPCRDYLYLSGESIVHLPEQFFYNEQWHLRLVLEGEDRLSRNREERERSWNVSYSAVSEDWAVMENRAEPLVEHLAIQETVEELLQGLTKRQRSIIQKYYLQEKTQHQISEELGISQQAVSAALSQAILNIRKNHTAYQDFFDGRMCCAEGMA